MNFVADVSSHGVLRSLRDGRMAAYDAVDHVLPILPHLNTGKGRRTKKKCG
jgi:hypothetical protein